MSDYPSNPPKIIAAWCREHLELENCDSFMLPLGDGRFVAAGTPEGIRTLLEMEGT